MHIHRLGEGTSIHIAVPWSVMTSKLYISLRQSSRVQLARTQQTGKCSPLGPLEGRCVKDSQQFLSNRQMLVQPGQAKLSTDYQDALGRTQL